MRVGHGGGGGGVCARTDVRVGCGGRARPKREIVVPRSTSARGGGLVARVEQSWSARRGPLSFSSSLLLAHGVAALGAVMAGDGATARTLANDRRRAHARERSPRRARSRTIATPSLVWRGVVGSGRRQVRLATCGLVQEVWLRALLGHLVGHRVRDGDGPFVGWCYAS